MFPDAGLYIAVLEQQPLFSVLLLVGCEHCQLAGSRASGSSMEVDLSDPGGFDSQAFRGQMGCSEVTVVGCIFGPSCVCVCVHVCVRLCVCVRAADEQGDLMPCDPDLARAVSRVQCCSRVCTVCSAAVCPH